MTSSRHQLIDGATTATAVALFPLVAHDGDIKRETVLAAAWTLTIASIQQSIFILYQIHRSIPVYSQFSE